MAFPATLWCWLIAFPLLVAVQAARTRPIDIVLRAKWSGTPLVFEASEFIAREDPNLFWSFLQSWRQQFPPSDPSDSTTKNDTACVDSIISVASPLLGPHRTSLLRLALSLRSLAPTVIVNRQLARSSLIHAGFLPGPVSNGTATSAGSRWFPEVERWAVGANPSAHEGHCCWVELQGGVLLQEEEVKAALASLGQSSSSSAPTSPSTTATSTLSQLDHVYPSATATSAAPLAVLYGPFSSACFDALFPLLTGAADEGTIRLAYRPVLPEGCVSSLPRCVAVGQGGEVRLGGYGVELALKNMEYKAIDDSSSSVQESESDAAKLGASSEADQSAEVKGFIFSKLTERRPELSAELAKFREHLLASDDIKGEYNVWELKDLGLQASQRIAGGSDPLRLMSDITQNFPKLIPSLSRTKVQPNISAGIQSLQRMVPAGRNFITINGGSLNLESVDLFSALDIVRSEFALATQLSALQIPPAQIRSLLLLPPHDSQQESSSAKPRLDFRSDEFVVFINDIEKDPLYRGWPTNLQELLMPSYPGQFRVVRKNIFHVVFLMDPAHPFSSQILSYIDRLLSGRMPFRLGFILASSPRLAAMAKGGSPPSDADKLDESEQVMSLFFFLTDAFDARTAYSFLKALWPPAGRGDGSFDSWVAGSSPPMRPLQQTFVTVASQADAKDNKLKADVSTSRAANKVFSVLIGQAASSSVSSSVDLSQYAKRAKDSSAFVNRLGLGSALPCFLFNGAFFPSSKVPRGVMEVFGEEMEVVQRGVYFGTIDPHIEDMLDFFIGSSPKRFNLEVALPAGQQATYVSLAPALASSPESFSPASFLHPPGTSDEAKSFSHLLFVDLTSVAGQKLLREAMRHLEDTAVSSNSRLAIFNNPSCLATLPSPTLACSSSPSSSSSPSLPLSFLLLHRIVLAATSLPTRRAKIPAFLHQLLDSQQAEDAFTCDCTAGGEQEKKASALLSHAVAVAKEVGLQEAALLAAVESKEESEAAVKRFQQDQQLALGLFKAEAGSNFVVTNGRVLKPRTGLLLAEDFQLLEDVEEGRVSPLLDALKDVTWPSLQPDDLPSDLLSSVLMAAASALSATKRSKGDHVSLDNVQPSTVVAIEVPNDDSVLQIEGVIDPLSLTAQRIAPLLLTLATWLKPSIKIFLNPVLSIGEVPLKSFYGYAFPLQDVTSPEGTFLPGPAIEFLGMPPTRTLTLNLKVPEQWLVEPVVAEYDLDNLVLNRVAHSRVEATFELESLLVAGHCYEATTPLEPPRGLQLVLSNSGSPRPLGDTIVMANLGYFQLQAAAGRWLLSIAEGKSQEVFEFIQEGSEGVVLPAREGEREGVTMEVVVGDLQGAVVQVRVTRREGMDGVSLLQEGKEEEEEEEEDAGESGWRKLFGLGDGDDDDDDDDDDYDDDDDEGAKKKNKKAKGKVTAASNETINIFSIASGHLYERFTRIMILSVLKHTKRHVKFWFIKNYLSPVFKAVIPHMAREYGFDYALITYKWPAWLHKQTEKQRLIWAYKILFLDVIFPLNLKKVIFVDADQIVREDMGKLYDMDLKGRPLAYTPMCDNNVEMEGYRFWKMGFWRDHLRGRPYHISALYVVDLEKLRRMAAGDSFRVIYESLSRDPNSLANLDQDLPNYAQHSVPIFSLPQEWLWCESWCGNATKAAAKTIDLCNNPMTKEPKLQGARRIVAEWPSLDEEQRRLTERVRMGEFDNLPDDAPHGALRFAGFLNLDEPYEAPDSPSDSPVANPATELTAEPTTEKITHDEL